MIGAKMIKNKKIDSSNSSYKLQPTGSSKSNQISHQIEINVEEYKFVDEKFNSESLSNFKDDTSFCSIKIGKNKEQHKESISWPHQMKSDKFKTKKYGKNIENDENSSSSIKIHPYNINKAKFYTDYNLSNSAFEIRKSCKNEEESKSLKLGTNQDKLKNNCLKYQSYVIQKFTYFEIQGLSDA